jgi:hypothetical protein
MAIRIASARALKAASALIVSDNTCFVEIGLHVVVVFPSNVVNVKRDTSGKGE